MTKDVVCGMNVNESVSLQTTYKGKTYYFCSAMCKLMFERDPEKYVLEESDPLKKNEE